VVDDEPGVARPLGELLSDEFIVRSTSSPKEAFASVLTGAWYDVILSDVTMPEMTGVDLHGRVYAVSPVLASRFVFMTAGVDSARLQAALDALPNLVLDKPVDIEDLRELIRRRVLVHPPQQRQLE
jgi:CheY-like chemotaxis protein